MRVLRLFLLGCIACARAQHLACSAHGGVPSGIPAQVILYDRDDNSSHLKFAYSGTQSVFGPALDNDFNFAFLFPSSGVTPATIQIEVNPRGLAFLQPGIAYPEIIQFTTVGQTPASTTGCSIQFFVPSEPNPSIQAVLNAASLRPDISPGAMVSIVGSHLTGPTQATSFDPTGAYPTSVASTTVTFNGVAAPLLYVSPSQINAIVPFALAGQTGVQVVVRRFNQTSAPFSLPLQNTSPGIFTATQSGSGQGAILQQGSDGKFTYNSSANPAVQAQALEIFATGMGVWTPAAQSDVFLYGENFTTLPVSVTIGGQPAKVLYAGTLGTALSSWSVLQVNVLVPAGASSGAQAVVLKIGSIDNSQQTVTVWLQ